MANVAINGMGRIGRAVMKIVLDTPELELRAVNDLLPADNLAYLLRHDSVYGRYEKIVTAAQGALTIDGRECRMYNQKDPTRLPWKNLEIDLVFECTGVFRKKEDLEKHLQAGAARVILSAPEKTGAVQMVVHGVNRASASAKMISCASCTTNCIAPVLEILNRRIGLQKAMMTTIHAYTSSQSVVDGPKNKWRRGRAAAINFVPTSTGAALAATKVLPELTEKFDGVAVRGPVAAGSIADMVFVTRDNVTEEAVNALFREEAEDQRYKGVLGVAAEPLVSSDIIRDSRASIVDPSMTQVVDGNLLKVMSWYDNEWGYSAQMVRQALQMTRSA